MILSILVLLIALSISGVAAYFSVVGLVALFAATAIPVAIMGGVLEVGKLVTAAWLHRNWKAAPILLRSYLTLAVMVLMLITSIGIYGFLSKGHLEQKAPVATLESQISRNELSIKSYNEKLQQLRSSLIEAKQTDNSSQEQAQAAHKQQIQAQIDEALAKMAPIDTRIQAQKDTIARLQNQISVLDEAIAAYNRVGAVSKGRQALADQQEQRLSLNQKIDEATAAIVDIEKEKFAINSEIATLKSEMVAPVVQTSSIVSDDVSDQIKQVETEISALEDKNLDLKFQITEISAKLGPILYVADLFNISDPEKAVQGIIVLIMFAFDPIAVSLVIASQWSMLRHKEMKTPKDQKSALIKYKNDILRLEEELQKQENISRTESESYKNKIIALEDKISRLDLKLDEETHKNSEAETRITDLIEQNETLRQDLTTVLGNEDFQFVAEKLRLDVDLTKGIKDLLETAELNDPNEGIPVESDGAKTLVRQINKRSWLREPKDKY